MKREHQQGKYEELKVTLNGGDPNDMGAIQVENKNKGDNKAHEQGCKERGEAMRWRKQDTSAGEENITTQAATAGDLAAPKLRSPVEDTMDQQAIREQGKIRQRFMIEKMGSQDRARSENRPAPT